LTKEFSDFKLAQKPMHFEKWQGRQRFAEAALTGTIARIVMGCFETQAYQRTLRSSIENKGTDALL